MPLQPEESTVAGVLSWSRGYHAALRRASRTKPVLAEPDTHIPEARWWVIAAAGRKRARLNCIHQLLQQMPDSQIEKDPIGLPARIRNLEYTRLPIPAEMYVPTEY